MRIESESIDYLKGKKFIGSLHFKIFDSRKKPLTRIEYLEKTVKDKKIIHLGCVDHLPLLEQKLANNSWLHKRLTDITKRCLGIDINQEGIESIKKLGYTDSIYCDIAGKEISETITSEKWDYIVLGEILEHVDNPVLFMKSIRENYGNSIQRAIITVPNGLRYINFKNVLKKKEVINSDHRYWFTPFTLSKICDLAGYEVEEFGFLLDYKMWKYSFFTKMLYNRYPAFLDNLYIIIKF
jgi:hypothetical protein